MKKMLAVLTAVLTLGLSVTSFANPPQVKDNPETGRREYVYDVSDSSSTDRFSPNTFAWNINAARSVIADHYTRVLGKEPGFYKCTISSSPLNMNSGLRYSLEIVGQKNSGIYSFFVDPFTGDVGCTNEKLDEDLGGKWNLFDAGYTNPAYDPTDPCTFSWFYPGARQEVCRVVSRYLTTTTRINSLEAVCSPEEYYEEVLPEHLDVKDNIYTFTLYSYDTRGKKYQNQFCTVSVNTLTGDAVCSNPGIPAWNIMGSTLYGR